MGMPVTLGQLIFNYWFPVNYYDPWGEGMLCGSLWHWDSLFVLFGLHFPLLHLDNFYYCLSVAFKLGTTLYLCTLFWDWPKCHISVFSLQGMYMSHWIILSINDYWSFCSFKTRIDLFVSATVDTRAYKRLEIDSSSQSSSTSKVLYRTIKEEGGKQNGRQA